MEVILKNYPDKPYSQFFYNYQTLSEKVLRLSDAEIEEISVGLDKYHKEIAEIRRENRAESEQFVKEFFQLLEKANISYKGARGGILKPFSDIASQLKRNNGFYPAETDIQYCMINGAQVKLGLSTSPSTLAQRINWFKKFALELQKQDAELNNHLEILKSKYPEEYSKIVSEKPEKFKQVCYDRLNELEKDKWFTENAPTDGDTFTINCCSDCDTWIYGERRCSCGNRRISLTVEGDYENGFYFYPEAY